MAADFTLRQGDRSPSISATLTDANGPIDLSAASVHFRMAALHPPAELVLDAPATIDSPPAAGKVSYAWQAADTDAAGSFQAVWVITFADGRKASVPNAGGIVVEISDPIG